MNCCQCEGIESEFNRKLARKERRKYQRKGPRKTTRLLIDALKAEGVEGKTLLDIGGGVGAIQHELLRAGLRQATHVDAASAYLREAGAEAARQGHADRIHYRYGDFVEIAADLPPSDIVTLDRVICCYPDMQQLVGRSAALAKGLYAVVYPRDTWWMQLLGRATNAFLRVRRSAMRFFVHPAESVDAAIRREGLQPYFRRETPLWQVVAYRRP